MRVWKTVCNFFLTGCPSALKASSLDLKRFLIWVSTSKGLAPASAGFTLPGFFSDRLFSSAAARLSAENRDSSRTMITGRANAVCRTETVGNFEERVLPLRSFLEWEVSGKSLVSH